ncbi:MAG: type II toxin-antitoxin system HicA family toxin [Deltaproteobacteria bacterium]|nr:type II toxin-antitoxin system HicA family toxin [Deltaproteobacteria bacterium]
MTKLPLLKGQDLIAILEKHGFEAIRQSGTHVRMKHPDGRVTTVPVHKGQNIGRGLLRKILRDTELNVEDLL